MRLFGVNPSGQRKGQMGMGWSKAFVGSFNNVVPLCREYTVPCSTVPENDWRGRIAALCKFAFPTSLFTPHSAVSMLFTESCHA
jgi:hypothetical protein